MDGVEGVSKTSPTSHATLHLSPRLMVTLHLWAKGLCVFHLWSTTSGGKGNSKGRAEAETTPQETPVVACHQEWSGRSTEGGAHRDTQLPVQGCKQVMVQEVAADAHVVH